MLSLLASLAQPIEDSPDPIERVAVAWSAVAPVLVLVGGALLLLAADALKRRRPLDGSYALVTTVTAGGAIAFAIPLWQRVQDADRGPFSTLSQSVGVDGFSVFATIVLCASVILAALLLDGFLRREGMDGAEPYVLMLLSAAGGVMMASANDLIVLFLGLEILSLAVYVMAAMHLRKTTSQEAGIKYFVLGAFSSAFFLYGIALVYGGTGSTNLVDIATFLSTTVVADNGLILAGIALLLVGFGFKVAAVPFHFWTPDV
jgi:NADH-quinone oxidoreductase subunit N